MSVCSCSSRYPKQQCLLALKKASVAEYTLPPTFLSMPSSKSMLQGLRFDSILTGSQFSSPIKGDQPETLQIQSLAAGSSFTFLSVGSGVDDGYERVQEIPGKWRYRRCEDIDWVKLKKARMKVTM